MFLSVKVAETYKLEDRCIQANNFTKKEIESKGIVPCWLNQLDISIFNKINGG